MDRRWLGFALVLVAGCAEDESPVPAGPPPAPPGLSVQSVQPARGPVAGGQAVTCSGSGFQTGAAVTFGGNAATAVTVLGSGSLACLTPPGTSGLADVVVTNPDLDATTLTAGYDYEATPVEALSDAAADPDVAVDGNGAWHVAWASTTSGGTVDVLHARSTDGGRTWSNPPANISASANASTRPRLDARGSTVVVAWNEANGAGGTDVVHAYSTDGGGTWSAVATVAVSTSTWQFSGVSDPDVALDGNGNLLVAYAAWWQHPTQSLVFYSTVVARGAPGGPFSTSTLGGGGGPPAVAASGATVLVARDDTISLRCWRSADGGATFGTPFLASGSAANRRLRPAVAIAGSTGALVSLALSGSTCTVAWRRSTDGGLTWSSAATLATQAAPATGVAGVAPLAPAVAFDGSGVVTVAFAQSGATASDTWSARSTDGGQTFTAPRNLSANTGTSGAVRVAGGAGGICVHVWTDDTVVPGRPDVLAY